MRCWVSEAGLELPYGCFTLRSQTEKTRFLASKNTHYAST